MPDAETNITLLASLEKTVALFKEEEDAAPMLTGATKSRHKTARTLLRTILTSIGDEVFFLCAFALPITKLGTIKAPVAFVEELQRWWSVVDHPTRLSERIPVLIKKFPITALDSVESQEGDGGDGGDESTEGDESGEGEQPHQLEAPMNGKVYELDPMDAIRVLATSKVVPILTIPHYTEVQPFITFRIPEKFAI
ncbi:hypothetical protein B0H63DRAFT_544240 [Podospora didyma]|uniref:Uncharacterized protein n=1 Tax=Podospora didyma TaxID=330526 RepID=A0AAE0TZZ4_9PEZI|nr:hypothetical protein B0H63DRAFT_544240 [Podospora didyma]